MTNPFSNDRRSFDLTTKQNVGCRATIPVRQEFPIDGSVLRAEFDSVPSFANPTVAGQVDYYAGSLIMELTPFEVNRVRRGYFRIIAKNGNDQFVISGGTINFQPAPTPLIVNDSEVITAQQISSVALSGDYNDLLNKPNPVETGDTGLIVATAIQEHVNDVIPHPVYDDLPSLTLLFENGMM